MMQELLGIILRVTIMYGYALALLRLSGKRTLGNLNALDFLVILLVGDQFDNVFWGESPVAAGLLAIAVLIGWNFVISYLAYRSLRLDRLLLGSTSVALIRDGAFLRENLARERISEDVLRALLREHGEEERSELQSVRLEENGRISIQKQRWAKDAQKKDQPLLWARRR